MRTGRLEFGGFSCLNGFVAGLGRGVAVRERFGMACELRVLLLTGVVACAAMQ